MGDDSIDHVARTLAERPGTAVEIEDGTEHFRGGAIRLVVDGSGEAEVIHRRAGAERRYRGRLTPERVAAFGSALADQGLGELRPSREVLRGGETFVNVALRRGDEPLQELQLPSGDRNDDDRLDTILAAYEDLVWEITDGVLPAGAATAPV
jgi:hypothetical protein